VYGGGSTCPGRLLGARIGLPGAAIGEVGHIVAVAVTVGLLDAHGVCVMPKVG
jgi:hypothetical protein